jgi:hypothetical protein
MGVKYHPIVNEMAEGIMSLNPKIEAAWYDGLFYFRSYK